jgi:TRAP-type C4-dicarboxylate transport system substrate-binding protein
VAATNGEVQCEVFRGPLGASRRFNSVALGTSTATTRLYWHARVRPVHTVGLFRDHDHAARVINGAARQAAEGLRGRGCCHSGAGSFGLQVALPSSWPTSRARCAPVRSKAWWSIGGGRQPVTMAFNEVYSALQQGVVDGQVTLGTLVVTMKYYEVVKHWIKSDFGLGFDKVVLSQRAWSRIKPAHQKMMQDLFFEMEEKKWYQVLKQSADGFYKKWEEVAGGHGGFPAERS